MARRAHINVLKQGVKVWNLWRIDHPEIEPDLKGADFSKVDLKKIDFSRADLSDSYLDGVDLTDANLHGAHLFATTLRRSTLKGANFSWAILINAKLNDANLSKANFSSASLSFARIKDANLSFANLKGAQLLEANLSRSDLSYADLSDTLLNVANLADANFYNANLSNATMALTIFTNNDLSTVKGLETIKHAGPSSIGIDTIYRSKGQIPESFLRGAGVPDNFISNLSLLVTAGQAIEFYSCFISYSHKDEEVAKRLHSRLRDAHIRVWFAPEDMKGGSKLHEQIDRAIQLHDRLLIVLSENSLQSEWVMTEIRKARKAEIREKRRKLFPIRLVDMQVIRNWECFDADTGKDLALEVREYFIPDFSNWKNHDAFEVAFDRLLNDLRAASKEECGLD